MSLYNDDELIPPSWINKSFFQTVLNKCENNENINVNSLEISPASMKGDHYASIMFRCKIVYSIGDNSSESKEQTLILKTLPDEGTKADIMHQSKAFETEIAMYTKTLPKIEEILRECGEPTKLAPKIIYHSLQPRKVLIFEDLCTLGYNTLRERYLTEEEIRMVYYKLAKLHAVSFVVGQSEDHDYVTTYEEGLFTSSAILSMNFISGGIKNFIELLAQHEDLKVYLEKVQDLEPDIFKNCKALYNAYKLQKIDKDIFVLNHGDFHLRNLMFKFNSDNLADDVLMLDFQICCYAPVNVDLIYSQYMILQPELRWKRNEFMQLYFTEFTRLLKKIKYQGELPRYSDLQIANLRYRHYSLFLLSTFLPFNHVLQNATEKKLEDINVSDMIENPQGTSTIYNNSSYVEELHQLLPSLLMDGYLD